MDSYNLEANHLAKPNFRGYKGRIVFLLFATKDGSNIPRWIGAVLFFFLFALPLHFHPVTDSQQITQECNCYCGGLSQLGSAPEPAVLSIPHEAFFAFINRTEIPVDVVFESECARAPPASSL